MTTLKPSNLLVSGDEKNGIIIQICDFDSIFIAKQTMMATLSHVELKGLTLAYAAPEICQRLVKSCSTSSDIYSWAITAYEILCNSDSAWSATLPILRDQLLIDFLKTGGRPSLETIESLYNEERSNCISIVKLLKEAWDDEFDKRPSTRQVSDSVKLEIFIKNKLCFLTLIQLKRCHFLNKPRQVVIKDRQPVVLLNLQYFITFL